MSGVGSLGHQVPVQESRPAEQVAPRASAAAQSEESSAVALKALQGLMKQLESAANTKAIPAHQNW